VVGNEVSDRRGDLAAIGACLRERRRDVVSHVARAALGRSVTVTNPPLPPASSQRRLGS
jgi:hypothetical protein